MRSARRISTAPALNRATVSRSERELARTIPNASEAISSHLSTLAAMSKAVL
jgi:hypothetical protein